MIALALIRPVTSVSYYGGGKCIKRGVPEQCFAFGPEGDNKVLKVPCVPGVQAGLAVNSFTPISLTLKSNYTIHAKTYLW